MEAGLSIAEMIASLSKPTVSLVLGGSHSIGGPLAVSAKYSFIVPSGHHDHPPGPLQRHVHWSGAEPSQYDQDPGSDHKVPFPALPYDPGENRRLMLNPTELVKDVGTLLEGKEAVKEGLIDEVGGMSEALNKLHEMIDQSRQKKYENM